MAPRRKLRRSAPRSVTELEAGVRKWINEWNADPKPFVWIKTPGHLELACEGVVDRFDELAAGASSLTYRRRVEHVGGRAYDQIVTCRHSYGGQTPGSLGSIVVDP